jgi:hypothetical protein
MSKIFGPFNWPTISLPDPDPFEDLKQVESTLSE